jgi:hypothetical protein
MKAIITIFSILLFTMPSKAIVFKSATYVTANCQNADTNKTNIIDAKQLQESTEKQLPNGFDIVSGLFIVGCILSVIVALAVQTSDNNGFFDKNDISLLALSNAILSIAFASLFKAFSKNYKKSKQDKSNKK